MKILTWILKLTYLVVGLGVIFVLFYIFAYQYLLGPLGGNDVSNAFIYIKWLDRFWPNIPLWWPEQGGGGSFVYGHQIGSYFIILFLHKVLGFTLIQGTRLLGFFSIYLTCVGIYAFTWLKSKSQTAAFLAGVFYLLSDIIWRWLFDMGLYAQSVSFMFVPPVLIFFDRFLSAYKDRQEARKRIFLALTAVFYALLIFTHIVSGVMIGIVLLLYALFYFQLEKWESSRVRRLWEGIKTAALVGISGLCLLAFWIFPYIRYFVEAGRDKVTLAGVHQIPYFSVSHMFGFFKNPLDYEMWLVTLCLGVGLLFFLGFLIAAFKNRSLFAWGLVALTFFMVMISPSINFVFMKVFYQYFARIGVRGIFVVSIIFPVLAGWGCVALPRLVFGVAGRRFPVFVFVAAMAIAATSIYFFRIPGDIKECGKELYIGLGPSTKLEYCLWLKGFLSGEEKLPSFSLGEEEIEDGGKAAKLVAKSDPGVSSRVDISPSLGNIMQRWNIYTDTSQFSLYAFGLSLIRAMWGYQQGLFYGPEPSNTREIVEVAKWAGIQRVILKESPKEDNLDNYPGEYWAKIYEESSLVVFELKEKVNLAELSSRPTLLVIGEHYLRSYEQIFRLGNLGAFPYQQFFLVEGERKFVDQYSVEELAQFDGVILYSYDFKNRAKGEKILEDYVREGGRLWIETGLQYKSPDWEREATAAYIPLKKQAWINLGIRKDYQLNKEVIQGIDEKQFAPLQWEDAGWSFSSAKNSLKSGATPVLSTADYPLIVVSQYGQGKVVWSGMNLFTHAYDKKNEEEVRFIRALASWLSAGVPAKQGEIIYSRPNPDEVNFTFKKPGKWLLWKESYSPYWRAYIRRTEDGRQKTVDLKFYRAGPGWVLIYLPPNYSQEGAVVSLRYVQSWAGYLGYGMTILTFLGFLLYLLGVDKKILAGRKIQIIPHEKISRKMRSWWEKEDET